MLKMFILGTLVSFVPMLYLGVAQSLGGVLIPGYHSLVMYFPWVYGVLTVLISYFGNWFVGGAFAGLLLSLVGRRMGVAKLLFPETPNWRIHAIAMVVYALVYSVVVSRLVVRLKCV